MSIPATNGIEMDSDGGKKENASAAPHNEEGLLQKMESTSLDEGTGDPASAWWRVLVKEDWEKITGLASNLEWYKYPSRSKLMAFPWAVYEAKEEGRSFCQRRGRSCGRAPSSYTQ
jgi:hypothetical protein